MNTGAKEIFMSIVIGLIIFLLINTFIISSFRIDGESMSPTLHSSQRVMIWKLFYNEKQIKRFDIVVFKPKNIKKTHYVKRVIGTFGDEIEYKNDSLYVNKIKINEDYLIENKKNYNDGFLTPNFSLSDIAKKNISKIPKGKILVLGDNRKNSYDSRDIGLIDTSQVVGKVIFRYFPIKKMGFISK